MKEYLLRGGNPSGKKKPGLSDKDGTLLADSSADLAERNEICRIFPGEKIQKTSPKVVLACTMSPYYWNRK